MDPSSNDKCNYVKTMLQNYNNIVVTYIDATKCVLIYTIFFNFKINHYALSQAL